MSGCPSHGELLGGFVLHALEPAEMEEMRRHLAQCPACSREAEGMAGLPALLDRIDPDDVPPPALSPAVEEAVLDRFSRERRRGEARGVTRGAAPRRAGPRRAGPSLRRLAIGVGALALAAVALLVALPRGDDEADRAYAMAKLAPVRDSTARATAYADAVSSGTRVSLWARGLDGPAGAVYELWCVREDGGWVSGGTFRAGADGAARAELTAAVKPGDYHAMVVTRRSDAAPGEARGTAVMRGELRY